MAQQERIEWNNGDEPNNAVSVFGGGQDVRQPSTPKDQARELHHKFMDEIERYLRTKNICMRIEYSSNAQCDSDDIVFQAKIIMVS